MLALNNANQLEYEVETAIKAVLFKARIAFLDKYAYSRLFMSVQEIGTAFKESTIKSTYRSW